ncbi:FAD:protein FMN transferase [Streptomyces sp. NPDC006784]|uniref:FAD:protein FMN transferase n=1 Tax=Streptomyces sp. NPDC006784 TaxID=3364764 RepID=UPI0036CA24B5
MADSAVRTVPAAPTAPVDHTPPFRHSEPVMGTVFSFALDHPPEPRVRRALDQAVALLHHLDRLYSPFRPDSVVSRMNRGELGRARAPYEAVWMLELADRAHSATRGAFDAWATGRLDLCGVVKGWAVEEAYRTLRRAGAPRSCVNGGGDVRLGAAARPGAVRRTGIVDPRRPDRLLAVVEGADCAVATSGPGERGRHITDPRTREPATGLLSATVTGPDAVWADVFATASVVLGPAAAHAWIHAHPGYSLLTVADDGTVRAGPDFPRIAADL